MEHVSRAEAEKVRSGTIVAYEYSTSSETMSDGLTIPITHGDQIHLAPGDEYFLEGKCELVYASTPKWTPEQVVHHNA